MAVVMAVGIFREELLFEWDSCFARLYSMQYIYANEKYIRFILLKKIMSFFYINNVL